LIAKNAWNDRLRTPALLQVQADVETQGDFVRTLVTEIRDATFATIEDVVAFVAWLDEELSFLVSVYRLRSFDRKFVPD
jgi:hypothetical protein